MPKRDDINKVLIIGSGPIVIGQACEFDYSGTQACKALRNLGYKIVLVNSNPATIMTDPNIADATYIEPLNIDRLTAIIEKERPDAILPNLGGQTGLNLSSELFKAGVLDKYNVKVIGIQIDAIERGEDRIEFKNTMNRIGVEMARSGSAYSLEEAQKIVDEIGFPVVVRPAYTMGGFGGGFAYNVDELKDITSRGIAASMVGQVLIEESILGWEELELEVVRDSKGQKITVCFIENIDPVGVHTGDSFCSAPMLTVSKEVQDRLQKQAYDIVDEVGVIGGTNVQFAYDPKSDRIVVIEINPRTSRSSALASKATGFPIALVSAMLASGLTLDEIECGECGNLAKYVPTGDYVVIKFARWAFEKFKNSSDKLGTQMKAVGEVMSIGKTYKEAFLKAIRSLEIGRHGLGYAKDFNNMSLEELYSLLVYPTSERQFILYEAIKKGADLNKLFDMTSIKMYFLTQMKELAEIELKIIEQGKNLDDETLTQAKKDGFGDKYLAKLTGLTETEIREKRLKLGVIAKYDGVHVNGTKNSKYYYSTYNHCISNNVITDNKKIMILGGGPNRIGQGIEFDYCCVHAAFALKELGFETIIVNCNPETVSTDYDTSDKLYFEPLTLEDVLTIYDIEKPLGIIAQFGGQTPLNLAFELEAAGVRILGTTPDTIDLAEDRDRFKEKMSKLGIPMPKAGMATTVEEALAVANEIGYPVMVRPSYVLGGRGMSIEHEDAGIINYMQNAQGVTAERPILIDKFLNNAIECEADAICDGKNVFVPQVMEHIEYAGVHSGDSACMIPSTSNLKPYFDTIVKYTEQMAIELNVVGLMNIQFAISDGVIYVLEANPRASRTVPLVSKVCGVSMVKLATDIITQEFTGNKSPIIGMTRKHIPYYGAKAPVFPFNMFPEVDPLTGPEMRSTGEVLGMDTTIGGAYFKAMEATGVPLKTDGKIIISVADKQKPRMLVVAKEFEKLGFEIMATGGTYKWLEENNVTNITKIKKVYEGRPNIVDYIINKEASLVINTPEGILSEYDDSYIRKNCIKYKMCYITTIEAAHAAAMGIEAKRHSKATVRSIQEYHKLIK